MSKFSAARVSQEAFDEVVKENMEDFELSPPDAVADAIKQFESQGVTLDNLDLSVPSDEKRAERSAFLAATELLDNCVSSDGSVDLKPDTANHTTAEILEALAIITTMTTAADPKDKEQQQSAAIYRSLLVTNAAIFTLMNLLSATGAVDAAGVTTTAVLTTTIATLKQLCNESLELKDAFVCQERVNKLLDEHSADGAIVGSLFSLIKLTARGAENNKAYFVKSGGCKALVKAMKMHKEDPVVLGEACFVVTSLCKFDDFRKEVSGVHDNAKELHNLGIIPALLDITNLALGSKNLRLAVAAMSAVRVLAINDEIVQALVASGLLDKAKVALETYIHDAHLVGACIGVFRNVSGNDEIKSELCTNGSLNHMITAMKQHAASPNIAEHGCGTLAAMALRRPENVTHIFSCDGANILLLAMKRHPKNVLVQRQGCLAIRNFIARNQEFTEALMELGVEQVLRAAGAHQGSVDEAYAGLRDLKLEAGLLTFDANGKQIKTKQFGDSKANFSQRVECSNDIDSRMDENAKPANQSVNF